MTRPLSLHAALALAGALTFLAACRSTSTEPSLTDDSIPFRSVSRGYQSAIGEAGVSVARTPEEWRVMWNRHTATIVPHPDLPAVDFATEMVVCARLGTRSTSGFGIEVVRLSLDDKGALVVGTRDTKPAADAMLAQVITQPYHMVATAKREGEVRPAVR